jgi:hypothetical protein
MHWKVWKGDGRSLILGIIPVSRLRFELITSSVRSRRANQPSRRSVIIIIIIIIVVVIIVGRVTVVRRWPGIDCRVRVQAPRAALGGSRLPDSAVHSEGHLPGETAAFTPLCCCLPFKNKANFLCCDIEPKPPPPTQVSSVLGKINRNDLILLVNKNICQKII